MTTVLTPQQAQSPQYFQLRATLPYVGEQFVGWVYTDPVRATALAVALRQCPAAASYTVTTQQGQPLLDASGVPLLQGLPGLPGLPGGLQTAGQQAGQALGGWLAQLGLGGGAGGASPQGAGQGQAQGQGGYGAGYGGAGYGGGAGRWF